MFNTVDVMTPFVATMLGFGIQQGAYTSEVVRSPAFSPSTRVNMKPRRPSA